MKKLILTAFFLAFLLIGCSKEINYDQLENRGNTHYIIGSKKPYSGKAVIYYSTGEKKGISTFVSGKLNGEAITFYKNGKLQSKSNFKDNLPSGSHISYDENGNVLFEMEY
ncbi:MAG: hypothetical protein GX287_07210 [Fusobacteria bacterium]|nr:hypothetical protein [Fusobacteriota bacterium]